MLEQKDLEMIAEIVTKANEPILKEILGLKTDVKELSKADGVILDEIERAQRNLEKQIYQIQKNLDELNQYYRITKLENDNTSLLLQIIGSFMKRLEELEKKIA